MILLELLEASGWRAIPSGLLSVVAVVFATRREPFQTKARQLLCLSCTTAFVLAVDFAARSMADVLTATTPVPLELRLFWIIVESSGPLLVAAVGVGAVATVNLVRG